MKYHEYTELKTKYTYVKKFVKQIYLIFAGHGGDQIINSEILPPDFKIKDFIIQNNEINRGLNYIHDEIQTLHEPTARFSSSMFYFSQYGGSKTQFLNLIQNEMDEEFPFCIPIIFENITQINPQMIFEKILNKIFLKIAKIPKFLEDRQYYNEFFSNFNRLISNIQVSLNQSQNIMKAEDIINNLLRISKNPNYKRKIQELDEILHSTILIDSIQVLSKIVDLLQFTTKHEFVFILMFDEVDQWLDDKSDQLQFSSRFIKIQTLMKEIFEIADKNVKMLYLFACTGRVNALLQQYQHLFSKESAAGSRLTRLYNGAYKIPEPGTYGASIDQALLKLSVYDTIYHSQGTIQSHFFQETEPILIDKFQDLSRRTCNSKIIELLKHYHTLEDYLRTGIKSWRNNTIKVGTLWQDYLPDICKFLNLNFVREDILVDSETKYSNDKIDGYFQNYQLDGSIFKIFVEIKLTKNFTGNKSYQVLQWLQLNPDRQIILLLFSPTSLNEIKTKINRYANHENYEENITRNLHIIHIQNPYAFTPVIGIDTFTSNYDELQQYFEALAFWLDFYGDFSTQYQKIKQNIGIDILYQPPQQQPELTTQTMDISSQKEQSEEESESQQGKSPFDHLNSDQRTCINILTNLYVSDNFSKTGRIYKSTIQKTIQEKSMGITNLDKYLEIMRKADIIKKITPKTVKFASDLGDESTVNGFTIRLAKKFLKRDQMSEFGLFSS